MNSHARLNGDGREQTPLNTPTREAEWALNMLWEMRSRQDLGPAQRPLVSLLLACILPMDKFEYLEECLDYCEQLKAHYADRADVRAKIDSVEHLARSCLSDMSATSQARFEGRLPTKSGPHAEATSDESSAGHDVTASGADSDQSITIPATAKEEQQSKSEPRAATTSLPDASKAVAPSSEDLLAKTKALLLQVEVEDLPVIKQLIDKRLEAQSNGSSMRWTKWLKEKAFRRRL